MASNPYVNKVEVNGSTIIDLTADTVDASHLLQGYTAHDCSGATITGTYSGGGSEPNYFWVKPEVATNVNFLLYYTSSWSEYPELKYSFDKSTWFDVTFSTGQGVVPVAANQTVYIKNTSGSFSYSDLKFIAVATSAYKSYFDVGGDVSTLLDTSKSLHTLYCFYGLFYNAVYLRDASQLILPTTTLTTYCYAYMFHNCTSLTAPPTILPATSLASNCYFGMFTGCTSLTTLPALPATTLANSCYREMFSGCTSLTTPPALPATTLAVYCYNEMFNGCTSLTTAPTLPATTLVDRCYYYMFSGCTSLTTPPALPATTLKSMCYYYMFNGCTSLIVSDEAVSGTAEQAWTIPTSGTFTNTYSQAGMFTNCAGTRSSDNMPGASGSSYTYYTQNTPVS